MRNKLKFLLGHEPRELDEVAPTLTVLDYLREHEGRTGTKEGCAEGDCGACTVVFGEVKDGKLKYRAVNSCIQFVPVLDGKQLLSVEDLAGDDGSLHPVQDAMVNTHGSQCGFCTPGFVMSLFKIYRDGTLPDKQGLNDALAGNLCRCTGYGPILSAAETMFENGSSDQFSERQADVIKQLEGYNTGEGLEIGLEGARYFAPATSDQLASLLEQHLDATIIAGLTDVGLWVTKLHRELPKVIYLGDVADLQIVTETDASIEIGAAATYSDVQHILARHFPDLGELIRRLGSVQIRNAGTLCGNIANGSPIGDGPPPLIVLEAQLVLRKGSKRRQIALEDFFIEYGKQDMQPSEFVEKIIIPKPEKADRFHCYKLTKRFDQDISAVCGAFRVRLDDAGNVDDIRICFGGMAGTPQRAHEAENVLRGAPWSQENIDLAVPALGRDYSPLSDMRGSAHYRMLSAQNLLRKFYLETTGDARPLRIAQIDALESSGAGHD